ncbi:LacI family DNA-binding transcriptional regulator [Winogradskyella sp. UBA3174]|uniref:LacI family DNA-binding transcriptional regulator n=1 Tax=Winogradskyella sp. UBA3174 TaxID=1947785 RepID=UPI0030DAF0E9|tara:strand:- start:38974 stop:39954 length:981 start_codon:yes stop_codon:yes gene_type:complete
MTLKDLAKIAGVSISTVSKALNDSPEIGQKTKERIHDLANLYNYEPNNLAINLKRGKTKTIGVIVPSIQNNFFAKVIIGIEEVLNASNYNIIISITNESQEKEVAILKTLSNGVVDGFLVAVGEETQVNQHVDHFDYANKRNKPIVLFDRVIKSLDFDKVIVDDKAIVNSVVTSLIEQDKKAIALVSAIYNLSVGESRKEGYLDAIRGRQDPTIVESSIENLEEELKKLLENTSIDAIVAADEDASLLSLKVARANGLKMPKDISILGFAPTKLAENVSPRLTTINQHGIEIGRKAAQLLVNKLEDNTLAPQRVIVNSTIVHRETT